MDLGDRAKDQVTGFSGIITGHCRYLTGCEQVLLTPQRTLDSSGMEHFLEPRWCDIDRVTVIEEKVIDARCFANPIRPGFDMPAPVK